MSFTFEQGEILTKIVHSKYPTDNCNHSWGSVLGIDTYYNGCVKCGMSIPTYQDLLEALESKINQLEMKRKDD